MPIIRSPLEGLPPEEQKELEKLDQEEEEQDSILEMLEGYSQSDLDLWMQSPFFVVLLEYMKEQKKEFSRILVEGTVTTEQPSVPGFIFRSDEALRGAVAFIGEFEECESILTEAINEANENYRDKVRKGE